MTTTRYPGNPDFHEIPPRCADCGQFVGTPSQVWERNDNLAIPDTYTCRCLECSTDREMDRNNFENRKDARHAILGSISR